MRFSCALVVAILAICTKAAPKSKTYVITKGQAVEVEEEPEILTKYTSEEVEDKYEQLDKNLLKTPNGWAQGVCDENRKPIIYTENFILESDNKSEVSAVITIMIGGNTNITCVEVADRGNGKEGPKILGGGVGSNEVTVSVAPGYGKGFDFTVRLYGVY